MPTTLAELDEAFEDRGGSTFEFCRDWLVSSETLVRLAMGAEAPALDDARDEVRARIHREDASDEPDEEEESETTPDLPPSVNDRPRAIVIQRTNTRERVGTGTWSGTGQLLVCLEVPIPAAYLVKGADDSPEQKSVKRGQCHVWAERLAEQIRIELKETSGIGDQNGTPYLNATNVDFFVWPAMPEYGEPQDYMAWIYEVTWR